MRSFLALATTATAMFIALASTAGASEQEPASDPLAAWHAALQGAGSAPADALFIGDSITEGYGAPSRSTRWLDLVRQQLQADWGGVGAGYLAAHPSWWGAGDRQWSLVGGRSDVTTGLGLRAHHLDAAGAEMSTIVETGSFRLLYAAGPQHGAMEISVDGTVAAVVDTYAPAPLGGQAWSSGPLGAGPHSVRVRPVPGYGRPTHSVLVEGIVEEDAPGGVRVWDAGHAGYGSTHFVDQRGWEPAVATADPELVVIALGTNDYLFQLTGAQFETNLGLLVDRVTAAADGPVSVALMPMFNGEGRDPVRYQPYVDAQRRLATARGLALIDLSGSNASLLTDDGVHPNGYGQRVLASTTLAAADPVYTAPTVPAPPGPVTASPTPNPGELTTSWTAVAGAEHFVVRIVESGSGRVVGERIQSEPTATFGGLSPGTDHFAWVVAAGGAGYSTPAVSDTTRTAGELVVAPADPTDVVAAHDPATGAVAVTWTAPAGPVTDYVVIAYDTVSGYVSHQTVTAPTATFPNLPAGRSYIFGVYARNTAGASPGASSNVVSVPAPVVVPAAPASVVASYDSTSGTLTATWSPSDGAVDYVVELRDTGTGALTTKSVTTSSATFTVTAGRSYVVTVYARNTAGSSAGTISNTVAVPAEVTAPAAPTNVIATSPAKGTVQVSWVAPAGPVTSYVVVIRDTVSGHLTTRTVASTTVTFTGLKGGRSYVVTVQAQNSAGSSPLATSNVVKVRK